MKKILFCAILAAALGAGPAFAGGDAEAGKAKAKLCAACHGKEGISPRDMFPNLAGQKAKYLFGQMKAFKKGKRKSPMMMAPMKRLSDDDMHNLAAYYSGLGH